MRRTALAEGFRPADVDAYLTSVFPGVREVAYTLETQNGAWTVLRLGGRRRTHEVVARVCTTSPTRPPSWRDGELCRPITYDYRLSGDIVRFVLVDDPCTKPKDVGELIAQTMIYESAPFRRLE